MKPEPPLYSDPLLRLLDEWQPRPRVSAGFDRLLQQRMAAAPRPSRFGRAWPVWGRVFGPGWTLLSMTLLVVMGVFFYLRTARPAPASVAMQQNVQVAQVDPVVRDLQALDRDGDLLENLDFLSVPMTATPPPRDRE